VTVSGRFHEVADAALLPPPERPIPLLVAATGPRMLRLTARYADAWNTAWFGLPDERLRGSETPARVLGDATLRLGEATLDVAMPRAPSPEQAQREIDIYLKTWQAMHPGSYARIVSEGRADSPT
jgi:hypothetical protein